MARTPGAKNKDIKDRDYYLKKLAEIEPGSKQPVVVKKVKKAPEKLLFRAAGHESEAEQTIYNCSICQQTVNRSDSVCPVCGEPLDWSGIV